MTHNDRRLRCAIYTRKSTEEGLDQAFNSLDAQREACTAYILSQQHEGWTLLPDMYDDGGYSGGNITRPALQRLLGDVKDGHVDIVVVYKIDRLTRALSDFAKIVDVLDAAKCSFVSVTQAFNTTSSMGRLTLNVLLSFAQFEREVIAERVRDKIAASKAKGMWMGGLVALGYKAVDRKLIIVPEEAATVRIIMERYLLSASADELLVELRSDGIVSKKRISRTGQVRGGVPFQRGALYHLLSNRVYIGETVHKDKSYPGQHQAIVSRELFSAVQSRLAERANPRSPRCSRKPVTLLTGMIFDKHGRPMSPLHANNHGRRYNYYGSNLKTGPDQPVVRLAAGEIELAVRTSIANWLTDSRNTRAIVTGLDTLALAQAVKRGQEIGHELAHASLADTRSLLQFLQLRVCIADNDVIASFVPRVMAKGANRITAVKIVIPTSKTMYGHEPRLQIDPPSGSTSPRDRNLIRLIARAFSARDWLLQITDEKRATTEGGNIRYTERVARLAYLAPDIVKAILNGTQPRTLTARSLYRVSPLPLSWSEQRRILEFSPAPRRRSHQIAG